MLEKDEVITEHLRGESKSEIAVHDFESKNLKRQWLRWKTGIVINDKFSNWFV